MSDVRQTVFSVNQLPQPDHVIDRLPPVFRIQSIERLPFDARNLLNVAVVFHERAVLRVEPQAPLAVEPVEGVVVVLSVAPVAPAVPVVPVGAGVSVAPAALTDTTEVSGTSLPSMLSRWKSSIVTVCPRPRMSSRSFEVLAWPCSA